MENFERVAKPFERLMKTFERVSQPFERLMKIFERVSKPFERLRKIFERVSEPFKLLTSLVACKFIDLRQDAAINNKRDSMSRDFFRRKV